MEENVIQGLINNVPPLEESIKTLTRILQILGGVIAIYVILWIVNFLIELKRFKLLKNIKDGIDITNKKLDKLLNKK
ncbi:MAG: hypothetical protein QW727_00765 [Candidatus Pacearchaeota archaeon]